VRRNARYCSRECAIQARREARPPAPPSTPKPPRDGPTCRITYERCAVCDALFVCRNQRRTCSTRCKDEYSKRRKRMHRDRRRARKKGAYVADVVRQEVYRRDLWICQLCGKPVDPLLAMPNPGAATIDHVVPLACGGTHEPDNVQLAHALCNSRKGARLEAACTV
jgi:5-methylcytosine-specific restriction endonuclease McrA